MNQRQATVSAILSVLSQRGVSYELNGSTPVSQVLTDNDKSAVVDMLCKGFIEGKVEMSSEGKAKYFGDPKELKKYVVGLTNNWLRKAPELNCGKTYEPKNPGSRKGSGDRVLKALKELMKTTEDTEAKAEIQAAIDERIKEISPKVEIDMEAIPAHLRHLVK